MKKWFAAALIFLLLCGCTTAPGEQAAVRQQFAMDTYMEMTAYGSAGEDALQEAGALIDRLDEQLDRKGTGEVAQLNKAGEGNVSRDTAALIGSALSLAEETGGSFDPTIAPLMDAWGFYGQTPRVPALQEREEALNRIGWERVKMNGASVSLGGTELDLGGIAKGYAADCACDILRKRGVTSAILSLGGNVQCVGAKPDGSLWQVAITDPENPSEYACSVAVADRAVVTSGGYQRNFEADGRLYHHILDPFTGETAESGVLSVTVIGAQGTLCDGLSTAVFVMGKEKGIRFWRSRREEFDVVFITHEGIFYTPGVRITGQGDRALFPILSEE